MNDALLSSVSSGSSGFLLFSTWDWLEIIGPILVLWGVIWEMKLLMHRVPKVAINRELLEDEKYKREVAAALIVVLGVAIELAVVPHAMKEVAHLKLRTARVETTNALIWETREILWQTNLVLRSHLAALEIGAAPRTITEMQASNFIDALRGLPRGPVMLGLVDRGHETIQYAAKIRPLLETNGFNILSDSYYSAATLSPNPGDSILIVFNSFTNPPAHAHTLIQAFNAAKIGNDYISQYVGPERLGSGPFPGSNEVLLLITEKP